MLSVVGSVVDGASGGGGGVSGGGGGGGVGVAARLPRRRAGGGAGNVRVLVSLHRCPHSLVRYRKTGCTCRGSSKIVGCTSYLRIDSFMNMPGVDVLIFYYNKCAPNNGCRCCADGWCAVYRCAPATT